ncbi:hypothetical protein EVJ58_g7895 [Rhodofomes roseus]|uniref:RNase H type-1 domain-containing protein n=1 Tax=Rhodofomes roseus TaxID=34475 RepID=A0A4Y9Y0K3_9APHY|nr:hypothetical protein EVJ58_g7895 [Rhodofomes roseus]
MRWVPGHKGIEGNELADQEAKKAARGDSSPVEDLPGWLRAKLPISLSRLRQTLNATITTRAHEEWKDSPRAVKMDRIDEDMPSKKYCKIAYSLPRRHASLLIQLRTEHVPLRRHLHRMQLVDSPNCQHCDRGVREMVFHYLLECPGYRNARARLEREIGPAAKSIRHLLNSTETVRALFRFVHDTGRFTATYGDLALAEPEERGKKGKKKTPGRGRHVEGRQETGDG